MLYAFEKLSTIAAGCSGSAYVCCAGGGGAILHAYRCLPSHVTLMHAQGLLPVYHALSAISLCPILCQGGGDSYLKRTCRSLSAVKIAKKQWDILNQVLCLHVVFTY